MDNLYDCFATWRLVFIASVSFSIASSYHDYGILLHFVKRTHAEQSNFYFCIGVKQSKKRGLSLEEKHDKMLQIFYNLQDFFLVSIVSLHIDPIGASPLLKELEKLGPKKGVISQSVKDVIQSLVDDDLVSKDKIGTSVSKLRNVCRKLEDDLQSDEREEALGELKAIEQKYNELKVGANPCGDTDLVTVILTEKSIEVAHAAANRWTDNIFTLRQWCGNNFPQAKEQLEHLYNEVGITDDFDYLELAPIVPQGPVGDHILEGNP
ncbi:hypothetical protein C3L33_19366, partial [Rhododendron williamsianum]